MKITVHGATGAQGGPVAVALRNAGHTVTGISRSGKASTVVADLEDQASLERAYAGADGVFIHLPIPADPTAPGRWVPSILGALAATKVQRVVLSTSGASLTDAGPHPMLQGRLQGGQQFYAGLQQVVPRVVALAPRLFLENLLLPFVSGPAIEEGVLAYPIPEDKPISWVSHNDIGATVRKAFESETAEGIYDEGIPAITGPELANRIGTALGRSMRYQAISPQEFTARATPLFGAGMAGGVGALYEAFASDQTLALAPRARQLGADKRLSVQDWANAVFR